MLWLQYIFMFKHCSIWLSIIYCLLCCYCYMDRTALICCDYCFFHVHLSFEYFNIILEILFTIAQILLSKHQTVPFNILLWLFIVFIWNPVVQLTHRNFSSLPWHFELSMATVRHKPDSRISKKWGRSSGFTKRGASQCPSQILHL